MMEVNIMNPEQSALETEIIFNLLSLTAEIKSLSFAHSYPDA